MKDKNIPFHYKEEENDCIGEDNWSNDMEKFIMNLPELDPDCFNKVYKDLAKRIGQKAAIEVYRMFKGLTVSFPLKFLSDDFLSDYIYDHYEEGGAKGGRGSNASKIALELGTTDSYVRRKYKEEKKRREKG